MKTCGQNPSLVLILQTLHNSEGLIGNSTGKAVKNCDFIDAGQSSPDKNIPFCRTAAAFSVTNLGSNPRMCAANEHVS